jgi:uncharacterized damage-inducible protein DinB
MFTIEGLLKVHEWSNTALDALLAHCAALPMEARHTILPGFGWPTIHSQLMHIAETEAFWITVAQGQPFTDWPKDSDWWDFAECERPDDLAERYAKVRAQTRAYLTELDPGWLELPGRMQLDNGEAAEMSPALLINHIITHSFHHKGQVVAMCRSLGHSAPDTDMNAFLTQ